MQTPIRIGTRESQLAVWQATQVLELLGKEGVPAVLVPIKSEGDIDLKTPLYEMNVQGIFTRSLDIALLNRSIDIAVHSMKDVPTQPASGVRQAAVLKRGSVHDLLVYKGNTDFLRERNSVAQIATSSIRRKAQWLHKYPAHQIHNLRGNVNTRLRKLAEEPWDAAIFAQAGLERIDLRPGNSIVLDWMLPAPAQGAVFVACREDDELHYSLCQPLNDPDTALCTKIERDFLRGLLGGCSTPISALAEIEDGDVYFSGQLMSPDGRRHVTIEKILPVEAAAGIGKVAADELLDRGGREIAEGIQAEAAAGRGPEGAAEASAERGAGRAEQGAAGRVG
ncbi:MAG TPA: hydroxymethylbilane synthase [Puia sp.]|jgi:hydroxymethylbilane synthase|nr:hydroxymethylbilane synthase [Puia sp.]